MSKPGRAWLPLDANFTRDPTIIEAGESAGWLYLAILGQLKLSGASGTITRREVMSLGITRPGVRILSLERVGLLKPTDQPGVYVVPAWASWQHAGFDRAAYMREWRAKQRDSQGETTE